MAGDRSDLDQDLDDLLADLAAGPRAHGRRCSATGWSCSSARPTARASRAPTARSCRSSSTSTWRSTATRSSPPRPSCARSTGRACEHVQRRHRAAGLHPRLVPHAAASSAPGRAGASRRAAARDHDPPRQGRQHGDGARRGLGCAAGRRRRTRPSSRPTPTTSACSHEGMQPENLAAVDVGIASHNLFDLAYGLVLAARARRARPGAVRDARRHGQPPAPGAVRADAQPAALRAGLPARRTSSTRSATSSAGSTRTPGRRTSCATPSRSRSAARSGSSWSRASSTRSTPSPTHGRRAAPRRRTATSRRAAPPAARPRLAAPRATSPTPTSRCRRTASGPSRSSPRWQPRHGDARRAGPAGDRRRGDLRRPRRCATASIRRVPASSWAATARRPTPTSTRAVDCAADDPDGWRAAARRAALRSCWAGSRRSSRVARGDLMGAALADGGKTLAGVRPRSLRGDRLLEFYRDTARWWQQMPDARGPTARASWSWSRRGTSPSPFPAAASRRRWRPATP